MNKQQCMKPKNSCGSMRLAQSLHRGEQQNIADRLAVGQQHGHAVDAEAEDGLTGHHGTKPAVPQGFSRFREGVPLCWTCCFLHSGPRDIEGWERRSEVLKSLEMTVFYHKFGALLEHFGAPIQRLFQCSSKLANSRFFRSLVASA